MTSPHSRVVYGKLNVPAQGYINCFNIFNITKFIKIIERQKRTSQLRKRFTLQFIQYGVARTSTRPHQLPCDLDPGVGHDHIPRSLRPCRTSWYIDTACISFSTDLETYLWTGDSIFIGEVRKLLACIFFNVINL